MTRPVEGPSVKISRDRVFNIKRTAFRARVPVIPSFMLGRLFICCAILTDAGIGEFELTYQLLHRFRYGFDIA